MAREIRRTAPAQKISGFAWCEFVSLVVELPCTALLFCRFDSCANELHESGNDSKDQSDEIEPGGVQPAVEREPDQPSGNGCGGKDECQLAVVCQLPSHVLAFGF